MNSKYDCLCPICKEKMQDLINIYFVANYDLTGLPEVYQIKRCINCSFMHANIDGDKVYNYYSKFSNYHFSFSIAGGEDKYDIHRYNKVYKMLSRYITKDYKICDLGCAKGGWLKFLNSKNYNNLTGVDFIIPFKNDSQINFIKDDVSKYSKGHYDCITLMQVLEHVLDFEMMMTNIYNMLGEGGILYIDVPDANRYYRYYKTPYHFFNYEHINHFNDKSISYLLDRHGFEVISSKKMDLYGFPIICYLCRKNSKRSMNFKHQFYKNTINLYIKKSYDHLEKILKKLNSKHINIWGIGSSTLGIIKYLNDSCIVENIIDSSPNRIGKSMLNKTIIQLSDIDNAYPILFLPNLYHKEILIQVKKIGIKNKVIFLSDL
ncbi:class I SAM-dependent methyltransferase [Treponema putidum]|uniref:class I SAM-dependent methyltransferase n=1 Tax=Treponema putidum TaxID=221027 RepID=UPI003D8E005D